MNISIRPELAEDRAIVRAIHSAAFATEAEADLVDQLRDGGYVDVSLVAEHDGELVGHILFSRVSIVTPSGAIGATSLAPMAVLPSHQRQGIGSQLVTVGLKMCSDQGQKIAVVLGHPQFYSRFGFSADLAKSIQSPFGGGDAWMAIELVQGALSGAKGRVEYPPPFAAWE